MATRIIQIADEQLTLLRRAAIFVDRKYFSDEEHHELGVLVGVIEDTLQQPDNPKMLHGFCL